MCKLFSAWEKDIQKYCHENGLDFTKAQQSGKCWGEGFLILQHIDPKKGRDGLRDETPAPVVLTVRKSGNSLIFEQTEHTKKYLAQ